MNTLIRLLAPIWVYPAVVEGQQCYENAMVG